MGLLAFTAVDAVGEVLNLGITKKEADWTITVAKDAIFASLAILEDIQQLPDVTPFPLRSVPSQAR